MPGIAPDCFGDAAVASLGVMIPHPADRSLSGERVRSRIHSWRATRFLLDAFPKAGDPRGHEEAAVRNRWALDIAKRAEKLYQAEYLGMAVEFRQFFVWSVLQDQVAGQEQIRHWPRTSGPGSSCLAGP